MASIYAQYYHSSGWWGNGDLYYGTLDFDEISRSVVLGEGTRLHNGNTNGTMQGYRVTVGYDLPITDYAYMGPVLGYEWHKSQIDGYTEEGELSTTMHFDEMRKIRKIALLGWRFDTTSLRVNPYLHINYRKQLGNKEQSVTGGINSSATNFTRKVQDNTATRLETKLGLHAPLSKQLNLYGSLSFSSGKDELKQTNYHVGLNYNFK